MKDDLAFPDGALDLVRNLAQRFDDAGIRYCQWKSTTGLLKAVAGLTDLDLLVHRDDATKFTNAVTELGFKEFISHPSRRFPSVQDYLGFDEGSGRLVHLHVYYRLVVGEHYVKNHVLPLETAFLEATRLRYGVRVPPPAAELVVLVFRALLQYRDRDAIKDLLKVRRRGGISSGFRAEIADLALQTSDDEIAEFVSRHMPSVRATEVIRFIDIAINDPRDARALVALRSGVRNGLRKFERMPATVARARYLGAHLERARFVRPLLDRVGSRKMRRKSSAAGGLAVALVGADGSGKSTLAGELKDWLSWRVNFGVFYLGTNQPSRLTAVVQNLSRVARRTARRVAVGNPIGSGVRYASDLITSVRYLSEARERASRARHGWRLAANGCVVVFDRYPLPIVRLESGRWVDGPRIAEVAAGRRGLFELLRRREEAEYRRLPAPDLTILLHVPPEVAVARKPADEAVNVERKAHAIIAGASRALPNMVVIDATCPLPDVSGALKREIWRRL